MPKKILIVAVTLMAFLTAEPALAQDSDSECPHPQGWVIDDLEAALKRHRNWLKKGSVLDPSITGRAILCNADLREANLEGAFLNRANFEGADLSRANLEWAFLGGANLEGARLTDANLRRADLINVNLEGAFLIDTNLEEARLSSANLKRASLFKANLKRASLFKANLEGAELIVANLEGASLNRANLEGADLTRANLKGSYLVSANLKEADLFKADLAWALLSDTNLERADLFNTNLERARLLDTKLEGAKLSGVNLTEAHYQPATAPAQGSLTGIEGLKTVKFCPRETSGLVQLRSALKTAGLRDLEREATYALERGRTRYALQRWSDAKPENCRELSRDRSAAVEGVFRLVFFEWTTDYGLAYGRPILILFGLIGVFAVIYLLALLICPRQRDSSGIYRIWPEGRIERRGAKLVPSRDVIIERLRGHGLSALGYAFYFSVVSAFHLGWRDLNVGSWIARLQPREYALRAKGWVRVVSGIQSLISVYLIAMWALTYFGRPFE